MAEVNARVFARSPRLLAAAGGTALAGAALLALWASGAATQALHSYLTAFAFVVSVQLGALSLSMIGYASSATWMVPIRRVVEAVASGLFMAPVFFVPLLLGAEQLYPWTHHEATRGADVLPSKLVYLNLPFFVARALVYFAAWIALLLVLRRASLSARDASEGQHMHARAKRVAAGGLPVLGLTLTFASFDWLMSLEPEWFSSVYGVYFFAGGFVAAISLVTLLCQLGERSGLLSGLVAPSHFHALGRLMLAFTIFWAYIAFFQLLLIYLVNRAEEVTFYVRRSTGSWAAFDYLLLFGHFVVPFLLLLLRDLKFRPPVLAAVAGFIVLVHYADVYWLVMPVLHESGFVPHVTDLAALLLLGGLSALCSLSSLHGKPVAPTHDPALLAGVRYRSAP